jgi:hypothetical protein
MPALSICSSSETPYLWIQLPSAENITSRVTLTSVAGFAGTLNQIAYFRLIGGECEDQVFGDCWFRMRQQNPG